MDKSSCWAAEDLALINRIPDEVFRAIVVRGNLRAQEVGRLASTCRRLSTFIDHDSFEIWSKIAGQTFPLNTSPLTLQLERAASEGRGKDVRDMFKDMCTRLSCRRCSTLYLAGDPSGCRRHPGVLISGHRMNGHAASWTCCGARSHATGCEMSCHEPDPNYAPSHMGHPGNRICGCASSSYTSVTGTGVPGSKVRGHAASSHNTFLHILRSQAAATSG